MAKKLIAVAADAGADWVKFQTFSADRLLVPSEARYEMLRQLELTHKMHQELIESCHEHKIGFLSTGFDEQSVDMLAEFGQTLFKIPSGEITNLPYLRHVGHYGKPIILSTGMANLDEIGAALAVLERAGTSKTQIIVLHCTTEYPAPIQEVNLRAMLTIRDAFGVRVGYSDHTTGIEVAIAAVALGATVIEKHFTLDRHLPGPDHKASLEPHELKAMVRSIRHIEQAMGDGIKRCSFSEAKNKTVARKSLVARQAIKSGDLLTVENIVAKRPGSGLSPMIWDQVLGMRAARDFMQDELIEL